MSQTLATKYRPSTFEDVCGQSITVKILQNVLKNRTFKHTYLFAGDSGCGKTTLARCFAKAINGGVGDPIEIDAASNNGVDNVRHIVEMASQRALDGEYKIYIIDECHAITSDGWKAFLKGIEEPPEYTIFMFCTTEPNKLPQAILNRLQRYNITKIDPNTIKERLLYICKQEGFTNYENTCDLISKTAHGCMRDAIMQLDQCADFSTDLSLANAKQVLTGVSYENMFNLTWALQDKNEGKVLEVLDTLYNNGNDLKNFIEVYLEFILDLTKYILFKNVQLTSIPEYLATTENPVVQQTINIEDNLTWFKNLVDVLLRLKLEIKYDASYKSTIEAFLLRVCR
jgi:DNA polymerase-3 subunit gamma/tau